MSYTVHHVDVTPANGETYKFEFVVEATPAAAIGHMSMMKATPGFVEAIGDPDLKTIVQVGTAKSRNPRDIVYL